MTRSDGLPIYLTTDDAADLLRTTRKAIYVMIERRQLPRSLIDFNFDGLDRRPVIQHNAERFVPVAVFGDARDE